MNYQVFIKSSCVLTDSQIIARAVGRKHREVLKVINSIFEDYPQLRGRSTPPKSDESSPVFIQEKRKYRGEEFNAYLLNESAFNLILPRFKTRKALDAFLDLVISFQETKTALIQAEANKDNLLWQEIRTSTKNIRHDFTDAIKDFADYSKHQGSKGYMHLYSNLSKQINKNLGIRSLGSIKSRDSLKHQQLEKIEIVEQRVCEILYEGMSNNKIYKLIKSDIKKFLVEEIEEQEIA
jgi:phage regulator Rha-like protein